MSKKAGHNEPDDMRSYDNHPMSPYYQEPALECHNTTCDTHYEGGDGYDPTDDYSDQEHLAMAELHNFCSKECHDEIFYCSLCEKVECECE